MTKRKNKSGKKNKKAVQRRQAQVSTRMEQTLFHQGPLPMPEDLARYDQLIANGAERILAMAEKNQTHRQQLEKAVTLSNVRTERLGQYLGFILFVLILATSTYLMVATDRNLEGLFALIADVSAFYFMHRGSQNLKVKELEQKLEIMGR